MSPFPLDVIVDQEGKIAYINREYDAEEIAVVLDELLERGK